MVDYTPREIADAVGAGLLSFPVTHFDANLEFDEPAYRDHLEWLSQYPVAGLFAAGGTGEFFSLTPAEVDRVVRVAIEGAADRAPVLAPAGGSTRNAIALARAAEEAGAAGILLFPPYLTEASQAGLAAHVAAVAASTRLGVIVYHRANARFAVPTLQHLAESSPNLIGFKDGVGDIELMTKIYASLGDRFTYMNGSYGPTGKPQSTSSTVGRRRAAVAISVTRTEMRYEAFVVACFRPTMTPSSRTLAAQSSSATSMTFDTTCARFPRPRGR